MIFSCEEILRKARYLVQEDIFYVREVRGGEGGTSSLLSTVQPNTGLDF